MAKHLRHHIERHINKLALVIGILAVGYFLYYFLLRPYQITDNAYVGANNIPVAAQVSGVVLKSYVQNNQYVKAGDLLFEIDPRPFIIAVQSAQAQLELMGNAVSKAAADVDQSMAVLQQRMAELELAKINADRANRLVAQKALPPESSDTANSNLQAAIAAVEAAQAQVAQARSALGKLGADNEQIRVATAALDKAKLDLSYTKIFAADSGQLSNYAIYPGQYIAAGYPQFTLISDQIFWVDANYKETELELIKPGQKATINIDMYPNKDFRGVVDSISGASGTVFSLLPPQNATGNWVKVTQRVPVRIIIKDLDPDYPLRVGGSASVKIRVR